jgi:predicted nucleic-acid-binding protein
MSRSLDANVVLRAVLQDDATQSPVAMAILREPCSVLPTVLLEVMWTLSGRKDWSRARIFDAMTALFLLPRFEVRYRDSVCWALERFSAGADFADMLHVALSSPHERFTTFDKGIMSFAIGAAVEIETL